MTITVKALEWSHFDNGNAYAGSIITTYFAHTDGTWCHRNGNFIQAGHNLEDAKAGAQVDYDLRILSALSVPAAAVVGDPVAGICPSCGGDKGRYEFDPQGCACSPRAWPIDTDDQVEALARECDWDNRKYMTPKDYAIWCERMRKFARLAALGGASHE